MKFHLAFLPTRTIQMIETLFVLIKCTTTMLIFYTAWFSSVVVVVVSSGVGAENVSLVSVVNFVYNIEVVF